MLQTSLQYFRYLYVLDEGLNSQKIEEVIKKQMELNLSVSILKDGEWGSYKNTSYCQTDREYGVERFAYMPSLSNPR